MAFLFDNLVAFVVGATLLVGLLFFQQRGQHAAIEATIRYQAEVQAASFVETLARDLENARTEDQVNAAFNAAGDAYTQDDAGPWNEFAFRLHEGGGETSWFQFVTLADPDLGAASPYLAVAYRVEPTGTQATAGGHPRDLHRVVRYAYDGTGTWRVAGGSPPTVVGFEVSVPSGATGRFRDLPERIDLSVELAHATPARRAGDQASRAEVGLTRQGATARIYASGTAGAATPSEQSAAPIPVPPWTSEYVPPPPPAAGGPGGGAGGGSGGGSAPPATTGSSSSPTGGGGGGSSTPPPPTFTSTGTL